MLFPCCDSLDSLQVVMCDRVDAHRDSRSNGLLEASNCTIDSLWWVALFPRQPPLVVVDQSHSPWVYLLCVLNTLHGIIAVRSLHITMAEGNLGVGGR